MKFTTTKAAYWAYRREGYTHDEAYAKAGDDYEEHLQDTALERARAKPGYSPYADHPSNQFSDQTGDGGFY